MTIAIVLMVIATLSGPSYCYDSPVHYNTTGAALAHLNSSLLSAREKRVVAFCTWLPDETHELNAIGVASDVFNRDAIEAYFSGKTFASIGSGLWHIGSEYSEFRKFGTYGPDSVPEIDTPEEKWMVAVQQLIHGLTGGHSAPSVTVAAQQLVGIFVAKIVAEKQSVAGQGAPLADGDLSHYEVTDFRNVCALGIALHLYGDSLAHRMLSDDHRGTTLQMYYTGLGHLSAGQIPDHPLCNRAREREWATSYATGGRFGLGAPDGAIGPAFFACASTKAFTHEDPYRDKLDKTARCGIDQDRDTDSEGWLRQQMKELASCHDWVPNGSPSCGQNAAVPPFKDFIPAADNLGDPCEKYLRENQNCAPNQKSNCVLPKLALTCSAVWQTYQPEAAKVFISWSSANHPKDWVTLQKWTDYYGAQPLWQH